MESDDYITEHHRHILAFEALRASPDSQFEVFPCLVNGEPATAICVVHVDENSGWFAPIFVSITPEMNISGLEGAAPGDVS